MEFESGGDLGDLEVLVRRASPGAVIRLKAGIYNLRRPLHITKPISLVGEGIKKTRIVCPAMGYVLRFSGKGVFQATDIGFFHTGQAWGNVVEVESGEVMLQRCRFVGGKWSAAEKRGGVGLWLRGKARGKIEHCEAANNRLAGIRVSDKAHALIRECTLQENGYGIIYKDDAAGQAELNLCSQNGVGMVITDRAKPVLRGNVCKLSSYYGVLVSGQAQPLLERNLCQKNKAAGICYLDSAGGVARSNECSANEIRGIELAGKARPKLEENRCLQNEDGIVYWENAAGIARRNLCRHNICGIGVADKARPILEANICSDNRLFGIRILRTAQPTLKGNRCEGNGQQDVRDERR